MKIILTSANYNFNPSAQLVDFDQMLGLFNPQRLLAIVNVTTGGLVYSTAADAAGFGGVFTNGFYTNSLLTFDTPGTGMSSSDILQVFYDDPNYITPTSTDITKYGGATTSLGQKTSANSIPVVFSSDQSTLPVSVSNTQSITIKNTNTDILGVDITGQRYNQVEVTWTTSVGNGTVNSTSGGSITSTLGHTIFSLGTTGTSAFAFSQTSVNYRPGHEMYAMMTAAWTDFAGDTVTNARLGLYNSTTDGFAIGYQLGSFGIFKITNSVTTFVARASWNTDLLTGASGSKFTSNGSPVAIDLTKSNLFRIRFAWLGSANIFYEVLSPDNNWVLFHNIRQPNSDYNPSLTTPNLTMRLDMSRAAGTYPNAPALATACWAGGTTSNLVRMDSAILAGSLVTLNRTVIEGLTTSGGGSYIPVKVTPSGSLTTDTTISSFPDLMVTGATAIWATNQNMLLTSAGSAGTDATGYKSGSVQVVTSAGTTGNWIFEGSNDNASWQSTPVFNLALVNPAAIVTAITATSSTSIIYSFPIRTRYIRLRSGASTTANVTCFTRLSQDPFVPPVINAIQATGANLNATITGTVSQATAANLNCNAVVSGATLASSSVGDMSGVSTAATGNSGTTGISTLNSHAHSFLITNIITGGTGSIDAVIQESYDTGSNWVDIYHLDRVTGVGTVRQTVPSLKINGDRVRYAWTVTGTITATMSALRIPRQVTSGNLRRIYNRTLDPNTLGSSTPALFTEGCEYTDLIVNMAAGGTAPVIQLQGSEDNTNWYNIGAALTATVGSTTAVSVADGSLPKFTRATVATTGTGTLNYIAIKAKGAS
jgi:hypothetical protein